MLEDKRLIWKFKHGSADALRRIYDKYKNDMLALAAALSNDRTVAEDIVQDVFVAFAQLAGEFQLRNSLRSYFSTAVANRVRSLGRINTREIAPLDAVDIAGTGIDRPDRLAISKEQSEQIACALARLPYEQRETIILHLQSGLRFRQIAKHQRVSVSTIQSRYRYGLQKLRSALDGEVEK